MSRVPGWARGMRGKDRSGIPRGHRFQAGIPALLHSGDTATKCRALNLSRSGVLLVGSLPEPPADVHLTLIAPRGDLRVRLRGRIARRDLGGTAGEEDSIAVEFVELDPAEADGLETLLARLIEGTAPGPLEGLTPEAAPHEIRRALDATPLAHRIALASRAGPRERELLRQDVQPSVLDALSRNPNLLLAEARALAALPTLPASAIEHLAADLRWSRDEELRLLLLAHPRTPAPLADRLLGELRAVSLRRLLQRSLPGPVREKAVKRLRQLAR